MNDTGPPLTLQDKAPPKGRRADIRFLVIVFRDQPQVVYRARYVGDGDTDLMLTNQQTRSRRRVTAADMQRQLSAIGAAFKN